MAGDGTGAAKGRRLRSTYGLWSIPYVDDRRLVFRAGATGASAGGLTLLPFLGEVVVCAADGWGAFSPSPAVLFGLVFVLGFVAGLGVWFTCLGAPWRAVYRTRIAPVQELVVERTERTERTDRGAEVTVTVKGKRRTLGAVAARCLVRATLFSQKYVFLVAGDRILELWRSEPMTGANASTRDSDWSEEPLTGGIGSPAAGPRVYARGATEHAIAETIEMPDGDKVVLTDGTERLLPVLDALRDLLPLSPAQDLRARGPELGAGGWAALHGLGIFLAALGAFVHWRLSQLAATVTARFPSFALSDTDPHTKAAIAATAGAAIGALLALGQWLALGWWLRGRVVAPVDDFAAKLVDRAKAISEADGAAPYREPRAT